MSFKEMVGCSRDGSIAMDDDSSPPMSALPRERAEPEADEPEGDEVCMPYDSFS